ncbi:protein kinase C-binding protein 1-like isoform X2 [Gigantopelta aegis]|uniref:protein kinase C-binding protein 1-like isoform X2 n=1 Tax=Gigantopelta aegis TaxID=1735272 RepID=UPI001B887F8D|nr:protein kinase C-binding protein 1-like isoform X2 [Gigantopelta aegis]
MPRIKNWKMKRNHITSAAKHKTVMSLKKGVRGSKTKDDSPVSGKGIRTRLSTGTIHVSGTQTFKDIKFADSNSQDGTKTPSQKGQGDTFTGSSGHKHRLKDVLGAATEGWQGPPPKKRKIGKNDGSGEDNKNDYFCWICHKDGLMVCCELCPRVYHARCLSVDDDLPSDWVCPECEKIMRAECIDTQSKAMKMITLDMLCYLLKFTLERMKSCPDSDVFINQVDPNEVPNYTDYVFHPMTLSQIEKNIKKKLYGSTDAFLEDAKWILHNSYVFNGIHHKLTSTAKTMLKICKHEVSEIEVCPDCYLSSCKREEHWFCQPCRTPHTLVWAKLKGYPFWPAKVLREEGVQLDVRFFGAHDRSWVSKSQVFLLSEQPPSTMQKRSSGMDMAMEEVRIHTEKIRHKFGSFEYAEHRIPYDSGYMYTPMRVKVKKRLKSPKKYHLLPKSTLSTGEAKPTDKVSVLSKTASALKSKYSSIITTRRVSGAKVKTLPTGVFKISQKEAADPKLKPFNSSNQQDVTVPKPRLPDKDVIRKLEEKIVQINEEMEAESSHTVDKAAVTVEDDVLQKSSDSSKTETKTTDLRMSNVDKTETKTTDLRMCNVDKTEEKRAVEDKPDAESKDSVSMDTLVKVVKDSGSMDTTVKVVKDSVSMDTTVKVVKDSVLDTPDSGSGCSTPSKSEYMSNLKKTINSCIEQLGISEDKLEEPAVSSQSEEEEEEDSDSDSVDNEDAATQQPSDSVQRSDPRGKCSESVTTSSKLPDLLDVLKQKSKLSDSPQQTADIEGNMNSSNSSSSDSGKKPEKESSSSTSRLDDVVDVSRGLEKYKAHNNTSENVCRKSVENDEKAKPVSEEGKKDGKIDHNISERNMKRKISSCEDTVGQDKVSRRETSLERDDKNVPSHSVEEVRENFKQVVEKAVSKEITGVLRNVSASSPDVCSGKVTPHTKYNVIKLDSDFEPTLVMEIDSGEESDSRLVIDFQTDTKNAASSAGNSDILSNRCNEDDFIVTMSGKVMAPTVKQLISAPNIIRGFPKTSSLSLPTETAAAKTSVLSTMLHSVKKPTDNTSPASGSSAKPASSEGVPSSVVETCTNKLVSSLKGPLEEFVSDIWQQAQNEVKGQASSEELTELRYIHSQEILELKHNFKLTVAEMKAAWEAEKNKLFRELKRIFDQEKEACVAAAKKKQWCANCSKEAIYYCCWNTSYCDYACQQAHWPEHLPSCMQATQEPDKTSKPDTSTSKTLMTTSAESSTLVKTSTSHSQSSWAEKEEAIQAQKAFNLTPPGNVPTLQNSSQSEAWRNVPRQQMATNIQFLSQSGFQVLPPQVTQPLRLQSQVLTGQPGIPNIVPHGQVIANTNSLMYPMVRQPPPPHQMNPAGGNLMPRTSVFLTQSAGGQPLRGQNVIPSQMQFQIRPSF